MNRVVPFFAGIAAGVAVGISGAFVQADRIHVAGHWIVYGVALAATTLLLTALSIARYFQSRLASLGTAIGWVAGTVVAALPTASDDMVLSSRTSTTVYALVGAVVAAMSASLPVMKPLDEG